MTKPRALLWMLSVGLMAFSSVAGAGSGADELGVVAGERIDPSAYGAGVVESMDVVQARDDQRAGGVDENPKARNGAAGQWVVPSRRASFYPHSGNHYAMNKWGDTRMGIQFPARVDVDGAYFAGQGNHGAWAPAVRAHGYRDGALVRTTPWLIGLEETPKWLAMDLRDVDRIVIEAQAAVEGAGWYGLDDLRYTLRSAAEDKATTTVVDFESADYGRTLTESGYANLIWELGSGDFTAVEAIHPPQVPADQIPPPPVDEEPASGTRGGLGTLPELETSFQTVIQGGGPGTGSIPPDTCGAIGPNHFVTAVNSNLSVYNKSAPHSRVLNVALSSFLPGSSGDPRILYDQHSGRWIVLATDFDTRLYFAVSTTSNPTGSWFKTNFVVSAGSDAGRWPDFPTLGVDASGIYTSAYMVGGGMSIFAIDKAPLIAPAPSLGTITAFRNLGFEQAMQPVHTYGSAGGEFYISTPGSPTVRIRKITGSLTSPSLTTVANLNVGSYSFPPDAPAMGSSINIDAGDYRFWHTPVYRNGFIWAAHSINSGGRSAVRWYRLNTSPFAVAETGTISSPTLYYIYPHIAVNVAGDAAVGFSGTNASQFVGAYYSGRRSTDPAGEMAVPVLYKAGVGAYNQTDGSARNRWGDYSATSVDPSDELTFWTMQEYAEAGGGWGTYVARLSFGDCNNNGIADDDEISGNPSLDCQPDGVLDACQLLDDDCNNNDVPDECDLTGNDCNSDLVPDDCQLAGNDCNGNSAPDDCDEAALAPTITSPANQSPCPDGSASFTVSAPGATGYQWFRNGSEQLSNGGNVSGATGPTLTIDPATPTDEGAYSSVVSVGCLSASSSSATLDLATIGVQVTLVTSSPQDVCGAGGSVATFDVSVNDPSGVTYQWSHDGDELVNGGRVSGANSAHLQISDVNAADAGFYTCTVDNACTAEPDTATGELRVVATFAQQPPPSVCAEYGTDVLISVQLGSPPPTVIRWYEGVTPLNNGSKFAGVTTTTLTVKNIQASDHGRQFRLRATVSVPSCTNYSNNAVIEAVPVGGCPGCATYGDMDHDGDYDLFDLFGFTQCFGADVTVDTGCICANINDVDNVVDLNDWTALEALLSGPN